MSVPVAIACQGGGSHTAFTAGVLRAIFDVPRSDDGFEVVALSGTSGGAICALLAWNGLIQDGEVVDGAPIDGRQLAKTLLTDFWTKGWPDGNASHPYREAIEHLLFGLGRGGSWDSVVPLLDRLRNDLLQLSGRLLATSSASVRLEVSPYLVERMLDTLGLLHAPGLDLLRRETDVQEALRSVLEAYVDFGRVRTLAHRPGYRPVLLIGAVDVLAGSFKVFSSQADHLFWQQDGITAEAAVASAAIPTLMRAVRIGEAVYWDGLFSQNPPIHDLPGIHGERFAEKNPQEIWVIRINPQKINHEPTRVTDIEDRRNELAGNLSLTHEVGFIEKINELIAKGIIGDGKYKPISIRTIGMSEGLLRDLDYLSKIDRKPEFLNRLIADGEEQGAAFLRQWFGRNRLQASNAAE
jgi:NTE family protein